MSSYLNLLRSCELKATPQRLCILEVLDKHEHPDIDKLYSDIKAKNPTISLATVYKNLNVLLDKGVVVEINTPNQKPKFDIYEIPHMHLVCECCGNIQDIGMEDDLILKTKEIFEKKANNLINKFNIIATVSDCECCR